MSRRAFVLFWGSAAAAVLFLGTAWQAAGGHGPADVAVFVVAAVGLAATSFVAGRIVFVVGRLRKGRRATRS